MNISTYESKINALEAGGGGGGGGGGATVTVHTTAIDNTKFSIPIADMANLMDGSVDKVIFVHPYPTDPATSLEEILRFSGTEVFPQITMCYYYGFNIESGITPKIDYAVSGNVAGVPMILNIFINNSVFGLASHDGGMAIYQLRH